MDIAHLDRYTGGERAINEEVFRLFETSCDEMLARLETMAGESAANELPRDWRETAHTLKGAARGIGAFELADAAADAEENANNRCAALEALERIKTRSQAVQSFIDDFLKGRA